MGKKYFTLPYITNLETESGWSSNPDDENKYSVVRCHFMLSGPNQLGDIKKGEKVDALQTLKGMEQEIISSNEYELTTVRVDEAVAESLREEESIEEFVSSLSLSIGSEKGAKLSNEIKDSLKTRLHTSFKESFKVQVSETLREKKTVTWRGKIEQDKFESNETIVLTKAYQQYSLNLYLLFVDYLLVEYTGSFIYLKRKKFPPVVKGTHSNIIRLDLPLASILFWKQLPNTLLSVNQKGYKLEVEDPSEIEIQELKDYKKHPVKIPPKPTLYDISERAFPKKKPRFW